MNDNQVNPQTMLTDEQTDVLDQIDRFWESPRSMTYSPEAYRAIKSLVLQGYVRRVSECRWEPTFKGMVLAAELRNTR